MKKLILVLLCLSFATSSFAEIVSGSVVEIRGTLTTGMPYFYPALQTSNGQRLELPRWIRPEVLIKEHRGNKIVFDAKVVKASCASMACLTGSLTDVRSATFSFKAPSSSSKTYSGKVEKKDGVSPSTGRKFTTLSIGKDYIAVPSFVNSETLYKDNAFLTIVGSPLVMGCPNPGACAPLLLLPLSSLEIQF